MVEYLHRNYVNPDTKAPYSTALIASALGDIKFTPVLHQSPDRQVRRGHGLRLELLSTSTSCPGSPGLSMSTPDPGSESP